MPAPKLLHQPLNSSSKFLPHYKHSIRNEHRGFLRSELLHIMCQLAKCEFVLSTILFLYGLFRPWYGTVKLYVDMCIIISVAGSTGILTCLLGFVALCKIRWKCMMIIYLVFSILSSVSYLLVLIFASIWLGELEKLKNPLKFMTHVSVLLLLSSVAIGTKIHTAYCEADTRLCSHFFH